MRTQRTAKLLRSRKNCGNERPEVHYLLLRVFASHTGNSEGKAVEHKDEKEERKFPNARTLILFLGLLQDSSAVGHSDIEPCQEVEF